MTLRQILKKYTATDDEIKKAEAAASEEVLKAPRGVHSHVSEICGKRITECQAFKAAAEIIIGLHTPEELDIELSQEKQNLFAPMMIAKQLLLQVIGK